MVLKNLIGSMGVLLSFLPEDYCYITPYMSTTVAHPVPSNHLKVYLAGQGWGIHDKPPFWDQ